MQRISSHTDPVMVHERAVPSVPPKKQPEFNAAD